MSKCEQLGIAGTGTQPESNYGQNMLLYGRRKRQRYSGGKIRSKEYINFMGNLPWDRWEGFNGNHK